MAVFMIGAGVGLVIGAFVELKISFFKKIIEKVCK